MQEFYYKNNELWCEDLNLKDLAERFGTPLYAYSKHSITDHCRHIERALSDIDHLTCYAVKANANRAILGVIAKEGLGADIGSIGEMHLALEAGFPHQKITYSGVGKRDDEIEFALENDIMALNVESEEEIQVVNQISARLGRRANILLRVNFDIGTETHPYITTGRKYNKFGVSCARVKEILCRARELDGIEALGIHSHLGSQIVESEKFAMAAEAITNLVTELRAEGIPVSQVNVGGGFGVQYHDYVAHELLPSDGSPKEKGLTTVGLLEAVLPILEKMGCKILIQPGRSIVAHSGILITKVLYRKETDGKTFVIVDAGMSDFLRPSLYQSYHQIVPLKLLNTNHEIVDVVGPLCESGDFFAHDRTLPMVERGYLIAIMCTGAYGYVLSSNYNGRPRPAEVMVDGAQAYLIRSRETLGQL